MKFVIFQIRDYYRDERERQSGDMQWIEEQNVENSSKAFSGLCGFLTVIYASFAGLVFMYSKNIIEENAADAREELAYYDGGKQPQVAPVGSNYSASGSYTGPGNSQMA